MANERLFQFPAKVSPVVADIVYVGDSAAAFAEVQCTIGQIFSAWYTAIPTASQFSGWDANKNLAANSFLAGYRTTATAAATTTLTVTDAYQQYFTGSTTQTVLLPVTSTLALGQGFYIVNNSSGVVTVQSSGGNTIQAMAANTALLVTCILTSGTTAASWNAEYASQNSALPLPVSLANGGTNAALTADNGAIVYSTGSALALLAHTTTAGLALLSGNNAAPSWSATAPLLTGGGTMAGNIAMGTNAITGMADPVNAQDAATKHYVDAIATGGAAPVQAATTANLTATYSNGTAGVGATLTNSGAQAAFSVDGYSASVGDRILVKNQSTNTQNGIYTVTVVGTGATNWVLTRAADYDTPSNINDTGLIPVINGTVNAASGWFNSTVMVTIGTTAVTYVEFTNITYPISLANGGTNANLTASNGGIFYSTASAAAILAGTATAGLALLSGSSTAPTWSTQPPITKINVQVFTSSGANTYTPTAGTQYAYVELWGAGGGGGSTNSASVFGAGGGGGAYAASLIHNPTSVTINIGAGGNGGGANNGAAGTDGGNTTYNTTTIVAAGGTHAANGNSAGGAGGTVASSTGTILLAGSGGNFNNGVSGLFTAGGNSPKNSPSAALVNAVGANGVVNSGQGGGGGSSAAAGGNGGSGYAVVTEFISA